MVRMPEFVLAIDTSLEYCSVAIGSSTECVYRFAEHAPRGHSELLHTAVATGFAELGWSAAQAAAELSGVVVTTGPGSFTGLRIGVAAAKGFAHAWHLPMVGVPTLDAIAAGLQARGAGQGAILGVAIPMRSGHCYAAAFAAHDGAQIGETITDLPAAALEAIRGIARAAANGPVCLVLGGAPWRGLATALADGETLAPPANDWPDPATLAAIGARRLAAGQGASPAAIEPQYLRRPGASEPSDGVKG
jgi:tRNA threonylcarbamoyladenosine biosynthesis protein TsaB